MKDTATCSVSLSWASGTAAVVDGDSTPPHLGRKAITLPLFPLAAIRKGASHIKARYATDAALPDGTSHVLGVCGAELPAQEEAAVKANMKAALSVLGTSPVENEFPDGVVSVGCAHSETCMDLCSIQCFLS